MWIAGLVVLGLAAFLGYKATRARAVLSEMATTETMTLKELTTLQQAAAGAAGAGYFRQKCEVVGTAEPGESGLLESELSDSECVWHRHVVTRKYWTTERRRDSDGDYSNRRVEKEEKVADRQSDRPFLVRDTTGAVPVHPANALEHMEKVVDRFDPEDEQQQRTEISLGKFNLKLPSRQREGTIGYKYEEWVLRKGRQVYVLGEVSDSGGELAITDPTLVSTKDEDALTTEYQKKQRLFVAGAGLGGVAGPVLVVIDLLT